MGQGCFEDELINGENWVAKEIPNYIYIFLWVSWEILRLWSADVSDGHGIRRLFRLTVLSIGMVDLEIRLVVN